jgi:hypothetical protein
MKGADKMMRIPKVAVIAAAAVVAATTWLAAGLFAEHAQASSPGPTVGPAGDAFYLPPANLAAYQPGDVIWYRPAAVQAVGNVASAWTVLYRSTDAKGNPDAVSGTILTPTGTALGSVPILGIAPGTQGLGDTCAPSKQLVSGVEYETLSITPALSRGWAVALTDYEGLGTPGDHTYVVGRSEGHATLDVIRAAQRLHAVDGLATNGPVGLYGYSQGGGGSAWAGELAPTYAPELNLKGIAAGGVPADLIAVENGLDGYIGAGFGFMAAVGFNAAYPELDLAKYLNDKGRSTLATAETSCVSEAFNFAFDHITDFTTTDPLTAPDWVAAFDANKLGTMPPRVPIFLYEGSNDEIVNFGQAHTLAKTYCAAGVAPVSWNVYAGEHVSTLVTGLHDAYSFLADRFAGRAATSKGC